MDIKSGFLRSVITAVMLSPLAVNAAAVSFYLDQTNIEPVSGTGLVDGINFLLVTIDDAGVVDGDITFTVQTLSPMNSITSSNYGIQSFSFNTLLPPDSYDEMSNFIGLPSGWSANIAPPVNQEDGFGNFDINVHDGGSARTDTLSFSITGVGSDSILSYLEAALQNNGNTPPQGSVYFAAHVAGFDDGYGNNSAFFGGMTPIPLPPALALLASALGGLIFFRSKKP